MSLFIIIQKPWLPSWFIHDSTYIRIWKFSAVIFHFHVHTVFKIAIILEWNIFIYILPSKQLSDVVKKKENLPSIDSRTPISQQFAPFMTIFEGLWSFQLENLIFQEMLWQAYVRRSQYKEGVDREKLRDANRKKRLPPNLPQTHYVLIHVIF